MYRVDLVGAGPEGIDGLPDRVISVLDLLGYLNAFRGADFVASTEYAEPCP